LPDVGVSESPADGALSICDVVSASVAEPRDRPGDWVSAGPVDSEEDADLPVSVGSACATAVPSADPAPATTPATAALRKTCLMVVMKRLPGTRLKPWNFL
jgi:hypothetical protein